MEPLGPNWTHSRQFRPSGTGFLGLLLLRLRRGTLLVLAHEGFHLAGLGGWTAAAQNKGKHRLLWATQDRHRRLLFDVRPPLKRGRGVRARLELRRPSAGTSLSGDSTLRWQWADGLHPNRSGAGRWQWDELTARACRRPRRVPRAVGTATRSSRTPLLRRLGQ